MAPPEYKDNVLLEVSHHLIGLRRRGIKADVRRLAPTIGISETYLKLILTGERTGYNRRLPIELALGLKSGTLWKEKEPERVNRPTEIQNQALLYSRTHWVLSENLASACFNGVNIQTAKNCP